MRPWQRSVEPITLVTRQFLGSDGWGMFAYLRTLLRVFVAAPFLLPIAAEAQIYPATYARLLTFDEAKEASRCPLCSYPDSASYFVRTAEGLNLAFADLAAAMNVLEALNAMADAQQRCDRAQYKLASHDYEVAVGSPDQEATAVADSDGVFGLLQPRRDLSALTDIVVPPFHACGRTVSAMRK
jgi:hypothetical protein